MHRSATLHVPLVHEKVVIERQCFPVIEYDRQVVSRNRMAPPFVVDTPAFPDHDYASGWFPRESDEYRGALLIGSYHDGSGCAEWLEAGAVLHVRSEFRDRS